MAGPRALAEPGILTDSDSFGTALTRTVLSGEGNGGSPREARRHFACAEL